MSVSDPFEIVGTTIAEKYRVERAVDEGGFSIVYRAEHVIWNQPVALKCFKILADVPEAQRDKLLRAFVQEGQLLAELSSRTAAIVQARDIGTFVTAQGQWVPYMVMEWLEGRSLDATLYQERMRRLPARTLEQTLELMEPAVAALDVAHAKNIAHRDIKPGNFFVIGDPRGADAFVKVLDFGIAKVMADHAAVTADKAHTGREITSFTPNYGAPEQFSRTYGATGPWTDVFALALVLVEILRGGVAPLEGEEFLQFALASRDPERRPTPRTLGVEVSDAVEAVFLRAVAVDPNQRYRTAGDFWKALTEAAKGEAPAVGTAPTIRGSGTVVITPPTNPQPAPSVLTPPAVSGVPVSAPPQTSKAPLALGVGALVVAGGAAAFFATRGGPPAAPTASSVAASAPVSAAPATSASAAAAPAGCPAETVLVPGGSFFMGSDAPGFDLWKPQHKVTLDTFCIDRTEVTAEAYKACADQGQCPPIDPVPDYPPLPKQSKEEYEKERTSLSELCNGGKAGREKHPMNCVSWEAADRFCKFRKGRLPTEAEWEFAARSSDGRKFPWGAEGDPAGRMNAAGKEYNAWEKTKGLPLTAPIMYEEEDGYVGTAPVGTFPKGRTKFGADDFVGNVWEWTADYWRTYKADDQVNPKGPPEGDRRAIRGGGFNGGVLLWLNPAFRYHQDPKARAPALGFRCAVAL